MDSLIKQFSRSSQLSGGNAGYIEDLYEQYLVDADSVGAQWKAYFDAFQGRQAGDVPHSAVMAQVQQAAKAGARAGAGVDEDFGRGSSPWAKSSTTCWRS